MTHQEFENLIGREATVEEYTRANGIYMSVDCTKQDFCKEWDTIKDSKVLKELDDRFDRASDKAARYHKTIIEAVDVLLDVMAGKKDEEDLDMLIGRLIDRKEVIRFRLDKGAELTYLDRKYIRENLT